MANKTTTMISMATTATLSIATPTTLDISAMPPGWESHPLQDGTTLGPTDLALIRSRYWLIALLYLLISTASIIAFQIYIFRKPQLRYPKGTLLIPCLGYLFSILSFVLVTIRVMGDEAEYRSRWLEFGVWGGFVTTGVWIIGWIGYLEWKRWRQGVGRGEGVWYGGNSQAGAGMEDGSGGVELGQVEAFSSLRRQQQGRDLASSAATLPLRPTNILRVFPQQQRRDSAATSTAPSTATLPVYEARESILPTYSSTRNTPPPM